MIKKIKAKIIQTQESKKIDKLNKLLSEAAITIKQQQETIHQDQVTLGQWQNRLYSLQMTYDAYRKAQIDSIQVFKDFYMQEKKDYESYNSHWHKDIHSMKEQIVGMSTKLMELMTDYEVRIKD